MHLFPLTFSKTSNYTLPKSIHRALPGDFEGQGDRLREVQHLRQHERLELVPGLQVSRLEFPDANQKAKVLIPHGFRRIDDDQGKSYELGQSVVIGVRGILSAWMKQAEKV